MNNVGTYITEAHKIHDKIKIKTNGPFKEHKKNVLVTGANGFLGKKLCEYLNYYGYHVYTITRTKQMGMNYVSSGLEKDFLGLKEDEYLFLKNKIDVVYHLAAEINSIKSFEQMHKNIDITKNMLIFSENKYFKHASTLSIAVSLKDNKGVIPDNFIVDNYFNYVPKNGYTATKIVCDKLVELCGGTNYRLGLLPDMREKSYLHQFIKNVEIIPYNLRNCAFDYTPVELAAKTMIMDLCGNVNVTSGVRISLEDIKQALNLEYGESLKGWCRELLKNYSGLSSKHELFEMTPYSYIETRFDDNDINKIFLVQNWRKKCVA